MKISVFTPVYLFNLVFKTFVLQQTGGNKSLGGKIKTQLFPYLIIFPPILIQSWKMSKADKSFKNFKTAYGLKTALICKVTRDYICCELELHK